MAKNLNKDNPDCKRCMLFQFCVHTEAETTSSTSSVSAELTVHKKHKLKRKESLYSYRDHFSSIYAIQSGAIKTYCVDAEGQERIHQFYLAGEILGFEAIHTEYYPFSAVALSDTVVCEISYNHLLDFVFSRPDLHRKILNFVSQRFNFGLHVIAPSAEQRLASFLLELSKRLHSNQENTEFSISMSRQDMGNYLGLAAETVSRVLTRLQQSRLISAENKKIKILEMSKLQWIAQAGMSPSTKQ